MHLIFYYCHFVKAVEIEFSEECVTEYQHRDKLKEMNVLEWIAKVIMEPLQVRRVIVYERNNFKYNFHSRELYRLISFSVTESGSVS